MDTYLEDTGVIRLKPGRPCSKHFPQRKPPRSALTKDALDDALMVQRDANLPSGWVWIESAGSEEHLLIFDARTRLPGANILSPEDRGGVWIPEWNVLVAGNTVLGWIAPYVGNRNRFPTWDNAVPVIVSCHTDWQGWFDYARQHPDGPVQWAVCKDGGKGDVVRASQGLCDAEDRQQTKTTMQALQRRWAAPDARERGLVGSSVWIPPSAPHDTVLSFPEDEKDIPF